jgi:hypothetical protein
MEQGKIELPDGILKLLPLTPEARTAITSACTR